MSDWSKVGRPIPQPSDLTRPFWDGALRALWCLDGSERIGALLDLCAPA